MNFKYNGLFSLKTTPCGLNLAAKKMPLSKCEQLGSRSASGDTMYIV